MTDLFASSHSFAPLAERIRPKTLEEYVGQRHLLAPDKMLYRAIAAGKLHSMILWGPPGVGKTTLARLLANQINARFIQLSAVLSGVKEIREAVQIAKMAHQQGKAAILFIDEVHRFNKSQQDAFLPHVEDGTFIFVGATTENPSFELNNALLSRARVYLLHALTHDDIATLIAHALTHDEQLASKQLTIDAAAMNALAQYADGDARRSLLMLEIVSDGCEIGQQITHQQLKQVLPEKIAKFDKGGDLFYEQISALHKSVRGSSADGALYWLCRMLEGGCDPNYIARRLVRMASEEIGNADPRALELALNAWEVQKRLGSPEGELALAQTATYLALAPKSNAVYAAYNQMRALIKQQPDFEVPVHLRNAPTSLMKDIGYGQEYRYAHDEPNAYAAGENYLPEEIKDQVVYQPVERGLEKKMAEKIRWLKEQDLTSPLKRYSKT